MTSRIPEPVARVAAVMRDYPGSWSLCGGWAVDAWVGHPTRDHLDVDVAAFRDDERVIFEHFIGWHVAAHDTPDATHHDRWDGRRLDFPAHIHAAFDHGLDWEIQINERSGADWMLSRDPSISVPLDRFARATDWGVPTMSPEILLWYKAQDIRPHDDHDFDALLPLLDGPQRTWLAQAIRLLDPAHRWLDRLAARHRGEREADAGRRLEP